MKKTPEAGLMIRVGDIDNLGFGWPEEFNPFTGKATPVHQYPWKPGDKDIPGLDRILLGSGFGKKQPPCGGDGYSNEGRKNTMPVPITIPLEAAVGLDVQSSMLMVFVDDFQSKSLCSKFQVKLNGKRFLELEKIINLLDQTGPIGKFVTVRLTDEMLPALKSKELVFLIDDPVTGAADGFAIDFVKLLINPGPLQYKGIVKGIVLDAESKEPVQGATIEIPGFGQVTGASDGTFQMLDVPIGMVPVVASSPGYARGTAIVDVVSGEESELIEILLEKSKSVEFDNQQIKEGESVALKNIQFSLGSAVLTAPGKKELDKVKSLMSEQPTLEIELSGHTSSDGDRKANVILSLERVNSCKAYLIEKGIDEDRISIKGYGPDKPIAPNDTESNRAINRRVEMRIVSLK